MNARVRALCLILPFSSAITACAMQEPVADDTAEPSTVEHADRGDGIHKVKHVIVLMQENHSFDNYFGALAYAPGSPYHQARRHGRDDGDGDRDDRTGCRDNDHRCVDGLDCTVDAAGAFHCANANVDASGKTIHAFHDANRCPAPDLDHGWTSTHREVNFDNPNDTRRHAPMNGFVRVNAETEQHNGENDTIGFYNQDEIPFYYDLAQNFAISDRFFASVLGPTFPNRSYLLAATSFGHVTTSDTFPPGDGYQPITGTIFDLLDRNNVSWADYFQDAPQGGSFRPFSATKVDPHFLPLPVFLAQAAGAPGLPDLPSVAFVDPNFGVFTPTGENDEHGGSYDHVQPARAAAPDAIQPGQCADLSNPPASLAPGGGAECNANLFGDPRTSVFLATELCPALAADPTGPFPAQCIGFNQAGVRVPFLAISPFAKRKYVSHAVADHTSILAFIETAMLPPATGHHHRRQHLTERDGNADNLLDMFDFERAPSRNTAVGTAAPPAVDCTPH